MQPLAHRVAARSRSARAGMKSASEMMPMMPPVAIDHRQRLDAMAAHERPGILKIGAVFHGDARCAS